MTTLVIMFAEQQESFAIHLEKEIYIYICNKINNFQNISIHLF